jgi:hypothetical protein
MTNYGTCCLLLPLALLLVLLVGAQRCCVVLSTCLLHHPSSLSSLLPPPSSLLSLLTPPSSLLSLLSPPSSVLPPPLSLLFLFLFILRHFTSQAHSQPRWIAVVCEFLKAIAICTPKQRHYKYSKMVSCAMMTKRRYECAPSRPASRPASNRVETQSMPR